MEILGKIVPIAMLACVRSSMLSAGLSFTVAQMLAPVRNYEVVVLALLANCCLDAVCGSWHRKVTPAGRGAFWPASCSSPQVQESDGCWGALNQTHEE
jgi:hypothetical protein